MVNTKAYLLTLNKDKRHRKARQNCFVEFIVKDRSKNLDKHHCVCICKTCLYIRHAYKIIHTVKVQYMKVKYKKYLV